MPTPDDRDELRERLLDLAEALIDELAGAARNDRLGAIAALCEEIHACSQRLRDLRAD